MEKEIYNTIDDIVTKICDIHKKTNTQIVKGIYNNFDEIISHLTNRHKSLQIVPIKSLVSCLLDFIVEGVINIINWGHPNLKDKNNHNPKDAEVFIDLYREYETSAKIISSLEIAFKTSLENFRKNYVDIDLCLLFREIYWDFIFRIKKICVELIFLNLFY